MNTDSWLNQLYIYFDEQQKPAWLPQRLWLSPQQKIAIIRELVYPVRRPD